jgi:hypothetical protein
MALAHAIEAGFYLHYAQAQFTSHRDPKWVKWREENFDGHESLARRYIQVARLTAVSRASVRAREVWDRAHPGTLTEALALAKDIEIPANLPPILSDYGKTPEEIEARGLPDHFAPRARLRSLGQSELIDLLPSDRLWRSFPGQGLLGREETHRNKDSGSSSSRPRLGGYCW